MKLLYEVSRILLFVMNKIEMTSETTLNIEQIKNMYGSKYRQIQLQVTVGVQHAQHRMQNQIGHKFT